LADSVDGANVPDEQGVARLIQLLGDRDPARRTQAIERLTEVGSDAAEQLCQAMENTNWRIREGAARVLGALQYRAATEVLTSAVRDPVGDVRRAAARALQTMNAAPEDPALHAWYAAGIGEWAALGGEDGLPPLRAALSDWDADVRRQAVEVLVARGDPKAVELLCTAIGDSDEEIRRRVTEGIPAVPGQKPPDAILGAASDPCPRVRAAAIRSLGISGTKAAMDAVVAALRDEEPEVRDAAAEAMARAPAPSVAAPGEAPGGREARMT